MHTFFRRCGSKRCFCGFQATCDERFDYPASALLGSTVAHFFSARLGMTDTNPPPERGTTHSANDPKRSARRLDELACVAGESFGDQRALSPQSHPYPSRDAIGNFCGTGEQLTYCAARVFMDAARRAQSERCISMQGSSGLREPQQLSIRAAASFSSLHGATAQLDVGLKERVHLLECFNKMCRRHHIEVPTDMLPTLLSEMLTELSTNQNTFRRSAASLVPVTAYCGAIGPQLYQEFPEFSDSPSIFKYAAVNNTSDPRGFLSLVRNIITELKTDNEFSFFRNTPSIFKYAAVNNTSDPRGFLRDVQRTLKELWDDEEFASIRGSSSIVMQVAMHNITNPRGFLRDVQKTIIELTTEDEFRCFRGSPWLFKYASVSYPSDPRRFLRNVKMTIADLAVDDEFSDYRKAAGMFKRAAVGYPSDPRWLLRTKQKRKVIGDKRRGTKPPSNEPAN
jgi:hypothetical protein